MELSQNRRFGPFYKTSNFFWNSGPLYNFFFLYLEKIFCMIACKKASVSLYLWSAFIFLYLLFFLYWTSLCFSFLGRFLHCLQPYSSFWFLSSSEKSWNLSEAFFEGFLYVFIKFGWQIFILYSTWETI